MLLSWVFCFENLPQIVHFLGLGFRPSPPMDNVESTLIWYKGTDPEQYQYWTKNLEKFLEGRRNLKSYKYIPF